MIEKFYKYKLRYKDYILLIKCCSFYEVIDNDALIINKIFNYKLKKLSNTFKVGFPISSLDNIIKRLDQESINYVVIDNDLKIKEQVINNYDKYIFDNKQIYYNLIRIENISNDLASNILNIDNKLNEIEKVLSNI